MQSCCPGTMIAHASIQISNLALCTTMLGRHQGWWHMHDCDVLSTVTFQARGTKRNLV